MDKLVSYNKFDPYEIPELQYMGDGFEYQYIDSSSITEYPNTNGAICSTHYWKTGKVGSPFGVSKDKLKEYLETGRIRVVKETTPIYMKVNEEYGHKGYVKKGIHIVPYRTYDFNKDLQNIDFLDIVDKEITNMKLFYYGLCAVTVSDVKGTPVVSLDQVHSIPRFIIIEAVDAADGYNKLLKRFNILVPDKSKLYNDIVMLHEVMTINGQTKYRLATGGHRLGVKKFGDKLDILESNPYSYCLNANEVLIVEDDLIKQKKIEKECLKPFPNFSKYADAHVILKSKMKTKANIVVEDVKEIKPSRLGKYLGKVAKWQDKLKPNLTAFKKLFAKVTTRKSKLGTALKKIVPDSVTVIPTPAKVFGLSADGKTYVPLTKIPSKQSPQSPNRLVFIRSESGVDIKKLPQHEADILVKEQKWVYLSKLDGKKLLKIYTATQRGKGKALIPAQGETTYTPAIKYDRNVSSNKVKKHVPNKDGKADSVFVNSGKQPVRKHKRNGSHDKKLLNEYEVTIEHAALDGSGMTTTVERIVAPNEQKAVNRGRKKRRQELLETKKFTMDINAITGKVTKTLREGLDRKPLKDKGTAVLIIPKTVVLKEPMEVTDYDISGKKTKRAVNEIITYEVTCKSTPKTSTKKKKWKHPISPKPVKAPF